ncbi:hypothetical protein [Pseudooceanicola sp.]|uniref:hypothetical protein n=1 Tax=Pseudooceanicola sp. TaxID=1914328 RepID=UPI0035156A1D
MSRRKKEETTLEVTKRSWRSDPSIAIESYRHGITQLTKTSCTNSGLVNFGPWFDFNRGELNWQSLNETMQSDEVSFDVLCKAGFFSGGWITSGRLRKELQSSMSSEEWSSVEQYAETLPSTPDSFGNGHQQEVFWVALWAQQFAEPLGEIWLAAMAQHAAHVVGNKFALGYFTALLRQKATDEGHFLRGRKTLKSAKQGGEARSRQINPRTKTVISEMKLLMANGFTQADAARIAFKRKLGTSAEANERLFRRHRK